MTDGKGQTTTWGYNVFGLVTNKVDATGTIILTNAYDADYRLTNRWSAAKGNTVYAYDAVGNLTGITYPVSHGVMMSYDALNRMTSMVDAVGTSVYSYNAASQLLSEDGPWASDTVTYAYAGRLRSGLSLQQTDTSPWVQTYGYDGARRLTNTASPAGAFSYAYDPTDKMLVNKLTLPNGAYITNTYDSVARQLSTILKNSGNTNLDAYTYAYNVGGQRTSVTRTAGDFVNYAYDPIGQLTNAAAKEAGGVTNRLLEQLSYGYDKAHNLTTRTNNALIQSFSVNNLNELSSASRSGTLTVEGTTGAPATSVTVNSTSATLYRDNTFAATNFTVANGNNTFTASATDSLGRSSSQSVTAYLPSSPSYTYDANGNLLSDGTRYFAYDDENQLINVWVTNTWMSQFVYDGKMRRRITREFSWNGSAWSQTNEVRYIYDGNMVIQERDQNNLPVNTYTRGKDLSGSLQGAGGIGGLLAISTGGAITPQHYYYHADGNGNVTALINGLQFIAARYLYDSFGNLLSQSGLMAGANTYRFSSKEFHANSGTIYYGRRFYEPNLQRWVNRDPIAERGG